MSMPSRGAAASASCRSSTWCEMDKPQEERAGAASCAGAASRAWAACRAGFGSLQEMQGEHVGAAPRGGIVPFLDSPAIWEAQSMLLFICFDLEQSAGLAGCMKEPLPARILLLSSFRPKCKFYVFV